MDELKGMVKQLLNNRAPEENTVKPAEDSEKGETWQDIQQRAKAMGINTRGMKKDQVLAAIEEASAIPEGSPADSTVAISHDPEVGTKYPVPQAQGVGESAHDAPQGGFGG